MMEKLKAKKAALLEEEAMHVESIKKIQAKIAIIDEMIADESGCNTIAPVSEAPSTENATPNRVVTIRI